MRKFLFLSIICFIKANSIPPELNVWFSTSELSYAGGGNLIFNTNSRSKNPANFSSKRCFSTSFIFYPAGVQAQSASIFLPNESQSFTGAVNHVSYGTFNGFTEEALATENFTSSETWLRLDYSKVVNEYPIRVGLSNQFYFSKLEEYKSTKLYFSFGAVWDIKKYKTNIGLSINDIRLKTNSSRIFKQVSPLKYNIGLSKELNYLPLKISVDYLSIGSKSQDYFISGIFFISKKLNLGWGTSTRKFSQNTNENVLKTILGSSGLGLSFIKDDIIIGYGLYFYGTSGITSGIDLSIKF